MSVPASPKHVPAIPNQLPVEPLLALNPPKLDNDYLDAVDYNDEEEPHEDLDDEEEYPEENPKMDLDEEEEDPKIDVDDKEEEEPLPASLPLLSPLRTPPLVLESSSDSDIPVTTTTNVGRPFKGPFRVPYLTWGMGTRRTKIAEAHEEAIRARRHLDRFIWEMSFVIERDILELMNDSTATGDRFTLLEQDNV
ncbi:hypothetical protein Tco_1366147 [Tanacetum coccineum]